MARIVWLLVIALVVYIFGSAAWKATQTATTPQHRVHSDLCSAADHGGIGRKFPLPAPAHSACRACARRAMLIGLRGFGRAALRPPT